MWISEKLMKVTITDEALNEIQFIVEIEKIRTPLVYLDIIGACCNLIPKVDVRDLTTNKCEIIANVSNLSISVSDLIKDLFQKYKREDCELKVDYKYPPGFSFQFLEKTNSSKDRGYAE
jgi:hypothetical protein